jgi:general stress protein 26
MSRDFIGKAEKIIEDSILNLGYCSLGLMDSEDYPTISTVTPAKADGTKWIAFVAGIGSNKAERISHCEKASVCFNSDSPLLYNITLVGTIEVLTDSKTKREVWCGICENHFSGPEDPNYCVLKFTTKKYSIFIEMEEESGKI